MYSVFICTAVSFYGSSFVSLPLEDARSTTKISFRLKTYRSDAIIFLSAGPIDYCLITLDNGALKLRINLGSGEAILTSKSGLKLNDLVWHQVDIDRNEGELSMTVDGLHTTYLEIPGNFFELNVKYGIYVGGLGDFNELFLGNLRAFRGCIENLRFNEINVFEVVSQTATSIVESVTFDCSTEFDGASNSAISFVDTAAFVVIPGFANSRSGASLRFRLKSTSEMAILFYSSGSATQLSDFIAGEIINGRISLSANDGNGVVVLQSDVTVNDGFWHDVELKFSPTYLEVSVDGKSRNLRPSLGDKKFYDLSDSLYIGGLELNKQTFAFQQGLQTVLSEGTEISLKGCLKDIKVNEQNIGIREAEVSKGIKIGDCLWHYPCLTDSPCVRGAQCYHEGTNNFRCICTNDVCSKLNFTVYQKSVESTLQKVDQKSNTITLSSNNITVTEGQSSLIMPSDISVSSAYESWINEYLVIVEPKYGWIRLTNSWDKAVNRFTPSDLKIGSVIYEHDGSETTRDWFTVIAKSEKLREQSSPVTIHVTIVAVNDEVPRIVNNTGLQLWQSTRVTLTNANLAAVDDDSLPTDIVFEVLTSSNGFLSLLNDSKSVITKFTQKQIDENIVLYTHAGALAGGFRFKVGDGVNFDSSHIFTVNAKPVNITLTRNQVLHVFPGMQQSITKEHLCSATSDGNSSRVITYEISKEPFLGKILIENEDGSTSRVTKFTQSELNRKLVLYEHSQRINDGSNRDYIIFDIKSVNVETLRNAQFVVEIAIDSLVNNFVHQAKDHIEISPLIVFEGKRDAITESNINVSALNSIWKESKLHTVSDSLYFKLLTKPKHGFLLFDNKNTSVSTNSQNVLMPISELNNRLLQYQHDDSNTHNDSFVFGLYLKSGIQLLNETIDIRVIQVNDETPELLTLDPYLEVIQGSSALVDRSILDASDEDGIPKSLVYQIIDEPQNGQFVVRKGNTETQITNFTQLDVYNEVIYFQNDGTRNTAQFQIQLIDGHFKPIMALFTVKVKPLTLYLVNRSDIELNQGSTAIKLSAKNLGANSNDANVYRIKYKLVKVPNSGKLLVNDEEKMEFTQNDVNVGSVIYVQINMSFSSDYFVVDITNSNQNKINNVTINVIITALMNAPRLQYLTASIHQKVLITVDHLDATPLAKLTKSNPKYLVTKKSKYGTLKKFVEKKAVKTRSKRKVAANVMKETIDFTHEDVVKGRIAFIVKSDVKLKSSLDFLTDDINFDLSAPNVQSANVMLKIKIMKTAMNTLTTDAINNQSITKQPDVDSEIIRPQINYLNIIITRDHLLIIAVVAFILLAMIIILIVMRVSSKNNFRASNEKAENNEKVRQYTQDSNTGSECDVDAMLMNAHHISMRSTPSTSEMETCIPPPPTSPSVSTNCGSVTDHRSRSVTPLKTYSMTILASHRLRALEKESEREIRNENSLFPLPPPSLYFGTESNSDSTTPSSQWCTFHPNTLPSKLSPSSSNYSQDQNYRQHVHVNDPATVRMMGDGTSNAGTPLPSMRKLPWSSEDVNQCMPPPLSLETRTDRCVTCNSPSKCVLPTNTFHTNNSNETSRLHTFATTPVTPMLRKRQHYWV
ncbi:Chondroitin sulfate proteoglycan 4-like protein [Leptotrombidium deliense]|uniref:Chondroitin sulfate proteoglycan 4-like protein n=1 Tax=Leptotrombidium deliense TaxID=299467 RepID=A0A443SPL8_9ACAR|nr:Chondroitin sulfate proteoglycan 4-like protein [Leptotrombidium deliense]